MYIYERERDLPIMPIKIHTTSYGPIKHTVSAVIELYQLFVISLSKTHTSFHYESESDTGKFFIFNFIVRSFNLPTLSIVYI